MNEFKSIIMKTNFVNIINTVCLNAVFKKYVFSVLKSEVWVFEIKLCYIKLPKSISFHALWTSKYWVSLF